MKTIFLLLVRFILCIVALTVLSCAVCFVFLQCRQLAPGIPVVFLPLSFVLAYFPAFLGGSAIAAGFIIQAVAAGKRLRLPGQIASALLVFTVWLAVLPGCAAMARHFPAPGAIVPAREISPGYFRPYNNGQLFVTEVGGGTVEGIFLPLSGPDTSPELSAGVPVRDLQPPPFSDVLVADALQAPGFLNALRQEITSFFRIGARAWQGGYLVWLSMASVCLPLGAISALTRAGSWKLKNLLVMLLGFFLALFVNKMYFKLDLFGTMNYTALPGAAGAVMDIPLMVLNFLLGIIFLLAGILFTVLPSWRASGDTD